MKPVVLIGQKGATDALSTAIDEALNNHELIKIKFIEFKEKQQKQEVLHWAEKKVGCQLVGLIGHMAIIFRQHEDVEKRKIRLPE